MKITSPLHLSIAIVSGLLFCAGSTNSQAAVLAWWRGDMTVGSSGSVFNSASTGATYNLTKNVQAKSVSNVSGAYIYDGLTGNYYTNTQSYQNSANNTDSTLAGSFLPSPASVSLAGSLTQSFTIEMILYRSADLTFTKFFSTQDGQLSLQMVNNGIVTFGTKQLDGTSKSITSANGTVGVNAWTSIAVVGTWDSINSQTNVSLYVNQVSVGTSVLVGGMNLTSPVFAFSNGNGSSGALLGYIDEVRISDQALTTSQFLQASAVPEPSTVALLAVCGVAICLFRKRASRSGGV